MGEWQRRQRERVSERVEWRELRRSGKKWEVLERSEMLDWRVVSFVDMRDHLGLKHIVFGIESRSDVIDWLRFEGVDSCCFSSSSSFMIMSFSGVGFSGEMRM